MIRIDMIQQNSNHLDRRERHPSSASCEVAGRRYQTTGPAPIYKLLTLLWLDGHGRAEFEVWDDVSPFGNPGGLAMTGRVRNWATFQTPKGMPWFKMQSKPGPNFAPDQRAAVAKAAGSVVSCGADSRDTPSPGCAISHQDGPDSQPERERAVAALARA